MPQEKIYEIKLTLALLNQAKDVDQCIDRAKAEIIKHVSGTKLPLQNIPKAFVLVVNKTDMLFVGRYWFEIVLYAYTYGCAIMIEGNKDAHTQLAEHLKDLVVSMAPLSKDLHARLIDDLKDFQPWPGQRFIDYSERERD